MARIYTDGHCIFCGVKLLPNEEVVVVSAVKVKPETTTSGGKYARELPEDSVKLLFQSGNCKVLYHRLGCFEEAIRCGNFLSDMEICEVYKEI